jgi:hypothetical protein
LKRYSTEWLDQYTPIRVQPRKLAKEDFNAVRLGILRLNNPLHIELEGIRGMRCILDDNAWIFLDSYIGDLPLLAWTKFQPRDTITTSIACELRLYHMHAGLLISKSLDALQNAIHDLLLEKYGDIDHDEIIKIDR